MRVGRPTTETMLTEDERAQLQAMSCSRFLPASMVRRATVILLAADGKANVEIADRPGVSNSTVGFWRRRFSTGRIDGLHDELRSGRPRSLEDEQVAELINTVLQAKPCNAMHWGVRQCAQETGVSSSTVHRVFKLSGLQPRRTDTRECSLNCVRLAEV